jgi:dipeptidyl aminopeptidase/acylaminoacyl peptidase
MAWPERLAPDTAILILHGGGGDALRMASALRRPKRSCRVKIYEGGGHDLIGDMADVRAEMDRWFDRYVRDRIPPPINAAVPVADEP